MLRTNCTLASSAIKHISSQISPATDEIVELSDEFYAPTPRLTQKDFKDAVSQKRRFINDARKEHKLKLNCHAVLETLVIQCSDFNGVARPSIATIVKKLEDKGVYLSERTIGRWLAKLSDLGILSKKRGEQKMTRREYNPPNVYTLTGFKASFHDRSDTLSQVSSSPKENSKIYMSPAYAKKKAKPKTKGSAFGQRHIDEHELKASSDRRKTEMLRVYEANNLKNEQAELVTHVINTSKFKNNARYLATIIRRVKSNTWELPKAERPKPVRTGLSNAEKQSKAVDSLAAKGIWRHLYKNSREFDALLLAEIRLSYQ